MLLEKGQINCKLLRFLIGEYVTLYHKILAHKFNHTHFYESYDVAA